MNESKTKKQKRAYFSIKTIPWFMGFSNDLMFYIAIDTLFLTTVKNLTASQISFFTTISCLCCMLLQRPVLETIKRIGNAKSVRFGAFLLLLGSVIITFTESYWFMMLGQILYTVSFQFKFMDNVMLKNNLSYLGKRDDYVKYKNRANIIYSIVTAIIALCAGFLFNVNHYLPMYLCIGICAVNVLLSFTLTDENEKQNQEHQANDDRKKVNFSAVILLIMLYYGIFYAAISTGQTNVKLFIQYQLEDSYGVGLTATYLSYILVASRISRILSNIGFCKLYDKAKDKLGYYLPALCGVAFFLVVTGSFFPQASIKAVLMSIGFCVILGIRDMFTTYIQDLLLKEVDVSEQQSGMYYLGLSGKIGKTSTGLLFSLMLLKRNLFYIIASLAILSVLSFVIALRLYKTINQK